MHTVEKPEPRKPEVPYVSLPSLAYELGLKGRKMGGREKQKDAPERT